LYGIAWLLRHLFEPASDEALRAVTVFSGFVTAALRDLADEHFALVVQATTLGVMRPSSLTITWLTPSMIATTLFVVPRSIPMIFP